MPRELPLRITIVQPPPDVTFRLQQGKTGEAELVPPARSTAEQMSFDFTLRLREGGTEAPPVFLGPCAQGPPTGRFVYVNSGTSAGQADSCWTRRAKVHLAGITRELIEEVLARPDAVLEARIAGLAGDGGPACATVPLLDGGWRVLPR